jgi:hypothetical protein
MGRGRQLGASVLMRDEIVKPELCTSCNRPINPFTSECGGCSD